TAPRTSYRPARPGLRRRSKRRSDACPRSEGSSASGTIAGPASRRPRWRRWRRSAQSSPSTSSEPELPRAFRRNRSAVRSPGVIFEEIPSGGCYAYLVGCSETCSGVLVDAELSQMDRILALVAKVGLRLQYLIDTHTHADHCSAARALGRRLGAATVMHRASAAPHVDVRVDDGETLIAGRLRVRVLHTPGHTDDSICLALPDRVLTGDTLLRLATGRTDLPTGDPEALHESLFGKLLQLDDALEVYPGHNYKGTPVTTLGREKADNPRLQRRDRAAFVEQMRTLSLGMPEHLTEALRTNRTGGKTVAQLLDEAARRIAFMSMEEVRERATGRD